MPASSPAPAADGVRLPPPPKASSSRTGLDLVDEAFHRLRLAPAGTLGVYYAGTLPFILALLYFWADQSRSPDATAHAASGGLIVTALFLWMKICQAVFAARLTARLRGEGTDPWTWARLGRLAFVQATWHGPGLFVLAVASVLTIPLGWTYAFYQNITVLGDGGEGTWRTTSRRAFRAALRNPRQNHAGLSILSLLGVFVALNLLVAIVLGPQLLKMFTGEENLFTRAGWHLVNTTFFAVLFSLVYLVLDPVAKAFYTLRCFYEDSLRTGDDLLSELAALPAPAAALATGAAAAPALPPAAAAGRARPVAASVAGWFLLGTLALLPWHPLSAADAPAAAPVTAPASGAPVGAVVPAARTVSPPVLGRSIDDALRQRKFAWRLPRPDEKEVSGPLDAFLKSIGDWLHARWVTISAWLKAIIEWLRKWWHPRQETPTPSNDTGFGGLSPGTLRTLMISLAVLLAALIAYLTWRQWQARRAPTVAGRAVAAASPPPDLTDDGVLATQLPEDEWLRLAQQLLGNGERRLALRAFYLSGLSSLAARGLLVIARHKSNRDYLLELRRRARLEPELQGAFGRNVARFERVWYGSHPADDALIAAFQVDRQKVLG